MAADDSLDERGGTIPGAADEPAFLYAGPRPSVIPILIAVPHAGRTYTPDLLDRLREPKRALLRLEDRLVDAVARGVASVTGAGLLIARAPRALIDLNRAPDDIDWDMLGLPAPRGASKRSGRAASGLGLIPRRLPGHGDLWHGRLQADDLGARIAGVHHPYHERLSGELARLRDRWGTALLIDMHSMPSLTGRHGTSPARIVIGDRFGAACDGRLVAATFAGLEQAGVSAAHNRPYAGGYVLERHGAVRDGINALQLEIDRSLYLDESHDATGPGLAGLVDMLAGLVRRLAGEVAAMAAQASSELWANAAE